MPDRSLPTQSTVTAPKAGTRWIWEIGSPHARTLCEVVEVFWNGEEWWTRLRRLNTDAPIADRDAADVLGEYLNELERFWEAVTPVGGRVEDLTEERSA